MEVLRTFTGLAYIVIIAIYVRWIILTHIRDRREQRENKDH